MMTEVKEVTADVLGVEDATYDLDSVGIEFEYPVGNRANGETEISSASRSNTLRRTNSRWVLNLDGVPDGRMTRDHVGAEITSSVLDLHTSQPEVWYEACIDKAETEGHPFAARGYGATTFGLHMHLSQLPQEKAEGILSICREPWMRTFLCASVERHRIDPWRRGGVSSNDFNDDTRFGSQRIIRERSGSGHYEWRLPEPVLPDHLNMIMHFLRLVEVDGTDAAREYAYERVHEPDDRLTAVQQYRMFDEEYDDFPQSPQNAAGEALLNVME